MSADRNPALTAFLAALESEVLWGQVLVHRHGAGFDLRHVEDRKTDIAELRPVPVSELRDLAQLTGRGDFRPLKAAPDLVRGWRATAVDEREFEKALHSLYPGALADWFAARSDLPPATHYREYAGRQSGMYRITQMLSDHQAAMVAQACCHPEGCLKRRLWTVTGLAIDPVVGKSAIPCLEPCAVLMELARTAVRLEQDDKVLLALAPAEMATLTAAFHAALEYSDAVGKSDFQRRARLFLAKVAGLALAPAEKRA